MIANSSPPNTTEFAALLKACDPAMRGLAFRLLGSVDAMDDALQDAYLKAYRSFGSFRGDSSFKTWLYTIVYRSCLDARTRRRFLQTRRVDEPTEDIVDHRAEVELSTGRRLDLSAAMRQLTPEHQTVLLLVDLEGLPLAEVADVLDIPKGTVASRVSRARDSLRRILDLPVEDTAS